MTLLCKEICVNNVRQDRETTHRPPCAGCGHLMTLVASTGKNADFPELRGFACEDCGFTTTLVCVDEPIAVTSGA